MLPAVASLRRWRSGLRSTTHVWMRPPRQPTKPGLQCSFRCMASLCRTRHACWPLSKLLRPTSSVLPSCSTVGVMIAVVPTTVLASRKGDLVRRPPVLPRVGADLCERFGSRVVQTVASWWPHALTGDKSRRVSGLQLLLDYQMATGCRGPVFSGPTKGWHEPSWSSRVDLHAHSAGQHVTWFMRVLRAVWHAQGVVVDCRKQRPDSDALAHWASAFWLPWPDCRQSQVEDWLAQQRFCGGARKSARLAARLPHASAVKAMQAPAPAAGPLARFFQ